MKRLTSLQAEAVRILAQSRPCQWPARELGLALYPDEDDSDVAKARAISVVRHIRHKFPDTIQTGPSGYFIPAKKKETRP